MKISFKMIRVGLTATLCAGLLAACDNRGTTPFKSKTWTKEEVAANVLARDGQPAPAIVPPGNGLSDGALKVDDKGALPNGESRLVTPKPAPLPGKEGAVETGSAQGKFGVEFDKREEEQRKSAKFDALMKAVDEAKADGEEATKMIASFSHLVEGKQIPYGMTIKAALNLNGHPIFLSVKQATVAAPIGDDVIPLAAELHADPKFQDAAQPIGNSLYVWAFCPPSAVTDGKTCSTIYLILDMKQPSGLRKNAVFTLQNVNGQFAVVATNLIGKVAAFDDGSAKDDADDKGADDKAGALPKSDKSAIDQDDSKSLNPAEAGAAGKDAQADGSKVAETAPVKADQKAAAKAAAPVDILKDNGPTLAVTKRGVPATRVNLAELSRNKNVVQEFKYTAKSETNTKSIVAIGSNAKAVVATDSSNQGLRARTTTAKLAREAKAAPVAPAAPATQPARIDVTQVVKSRAPLKVNGVDVYAQNKMSAAQTQVAAAKTAGKPALTINGQAVLTESTTPNTATASTASGSQSLRTRTAAAKKQHEAALKTKDAKAVVKSAEAQ